MKKIVVHSLWLVLALFAIAGCVKEDFDKVPPVYSNLDATTTIKEFRALYGSDVVGLKKISSLYSQSFYNNLKSRGLDTVLVIKGVVVSSDSAGAFYKSVWIEDGTGGIEVTVEAKDMYSAYGFKPGWPVVLKLSDLYAMRSRSDYDVQIGVPSEDGGELSLGKIDGDQINKYIQLSGARMSENPLSVKLSELNDSLKGRLIRIDGVEFLSIDTASLFVNGSSTTNRDLYDCYENKIVLRTSGYATFGAMSLPNLNGSAVGVLTKFGPSTYQLVIRSEKDLSFVNERCVVPAAFYSEDFTSFTAGVAINEKGWTSFRVQGADRDWRVKDETGSKFAEFSSFGSTSAVNEGWLVSPAIDITGYSNASVKFETSYDFWTHDAISVYVSTDFDGTNLATANWSPLPARIASKALGDKYKTWISSRRLSLAGYTGKVYVAFKYVGNNSAKQTTTYRIDNFVVSGTK